MHGIVAASAGIEGTLLWRWWGCRVWACSGLWSLGHCQWGICRLLWDLTVQQSPSPSCWSLAPTARSLGHGKLPSSLLLVTTCAFRCPIPWRQDKSIVRALTMGQALCPGTGHHCTPLPPFSRICSCSPALLPAFPDVYAGWFCWQAALWPQLSHPSGAIPTPGLPLGLSRCGAPVAHGSTLYPSGQKPLLPWPAGGGGSCTCGLGPSEGQALHVIVNGNDIDSVLRTWPEAMQLSSVFFATWGRQ